MKNSQKAYFEEILSMIKVIIAILAYANGLKTLCVIFIILAAFDFMCGAKFAIKGLLNRKRKNRPTIIDKQATK